MTLAAASPLVLALCSATRNASVALLREGEPSLELWAGHGRQHAESLLPLVDEILRRAGCELSEITGYALCIGPGSFTSLRVGLATVKGLAFGSATPVAPVSSLRILAAATAGDGQRPVIGMLDAMRDEVYAAAYTGESGDWAPQPEILPERVYTAEELAERIPANALLIGEGTQVVYESLREQLGEGVEIAQPISLPIAPTRLNGIAAEGRAGAGSTTPGEERPLIGPQRPMEPSAAVAGRLGVVTLLARQGVSAAGLGPRYVRRAEAEVLRTSERFEAAPDLSPNRPPGFDTTRKLS